MNRINKNINELNSLVLMINELLEIYSDAIINENLKRIMSEAKKIVNDRYNDLKKQIQSLKVHCTIELTKSQEFKLIIEKMNIKQKEDFPFCMEIMYFLKTEEFKLFELLYNGRDYFPSSIVVVIKKLISELSNITLKFSNYALNLFY